MPRLTCIEYSGGVGFQEFAFIYNGWYMIEPGAGSLMTYLSQAPDPRGRLGNILTNSKTTTSLFICDVGNGSFRLVERNARV